jgi:hypothetical protein
VGRVVRKCARNRFFGKDGCVEFEVEFRDGDGPADIEETLTGVPTEDGFRRLNERVMSDPRFRAGLKILVDCSALNTTGLTNQEVQGLSEHMLVRDWDYPPAAVAIIAPDEETSSKVTDYRAHLGGSRSNRQMFRNRADAVAWLEEQRGS